MKELSKGTRNVIILVVLLVGLYIASPTIEGELCSDFAVCGDDNVTYSNDCRAMIAGVNYTDGPCGGVIPPLDG